MQTTEEVARAYRGSLVIPVGEVAKRASNSGRTGLGNSDVAVSSIAVSRCFHKKEFFFDILWLSNVSTIPFVSLFSHISRMNAFDALSSSLLPAFFS